MLLAIVIPPVMHQTFVRPFSEKLPATQRVLDREDAVFAVTKGAVKNRPRFTTSNFFQEDLLSRETRGLCELFPCPRLWPKYAIDRSPPHGGPVPNVTRQEISSVARLSAALLPHPSSAILPLAKPVHDRSHKPRSDHQLPKQANRGGDQHRPGQYRVRY